MNKAKLLKRLDTICNNCGDCFYLSRNTQYDCYIKIGQLIKDIKDGKFDKKQRATTTMAGVLRGKRPHPPKKFMRNE